LAGPCWHGATEAVVLSRLQTIVVDWIEILALFGEPLPNADGVKAMLETAELLANPAACKAIADAEAGKGRAYSLDELRR
jgi:hypothetical protein